MLDKRYARMDYLSHDDVIHLVRPDVGPDQGAGDGRRPELVAPQGRQAAVEATCEGRMQL